MVEREGGPSAEGAIREPRGRWKGTGGHRAYQHCADCSRLARLERVLLLVRALIELIVDRL